MTLSRPLEASITREENPLSPLEASNGSSESSPVQRLDEMMEIRRLEEKVWSAIKLLVANRLAGFLFLESLFVQAL